MILAGTSSKQIRRRFAKVAVLEIHVMELLLVHNGHGAQRIAQQRPPDLQHAVLARCERESRKPDRYERHAVAFDGLQILRKQADLLQLARSVRDGGASFGEANKSIRRINFGSHLALDARNAGGMLALDLGPWTLDIQPERHLLVFAQGTRVESNST